MNTDSRKALWLERLLKRDPRWVDGDIVTTSQQSKTADLVNKKLNVCLELKQDQTYNPPPLGMHQVNNLDTLSNRLKGYAQSANKKFRNYPNFKTVLIIETQLRKNIIKHLISNLTQVTVTSGQITVRQRNVYFSRDTEEIGGYLFCSWSENKAYYLLNPFGEVSHILASKTFIKLLPPGLLFEEIAIVEDYHSI